MARGYLLCRTIAIYFSKASHESDVFEFHRIPFVKYDYAIPIF